MHWDKAIVKKDPSGIRSSSKLRRSYLKQQRSTTKCVINLFRLEVVVVGSEFWNNLLGTSGRAKITRAELHLMCHSEVAFLFSSKASLQVTLDWAADWGQGSWFVFSFRTICLVQLAPILGCLSPRRLKDTHSCIFSLSWRKNSMERRCVTLSRQTSYSPIFHYS